MKIVDNYEFKTGELKDVRVKIINNSNKNLRLQFGYLLSKGWEIIISPKMINLLCGESKFINVFLKAPAEVTAGDYHLKFILKNKEIEYIKKFKLNVKKVNDLKINLVKRPKYINKEFNLQLFVENRGNTKRKLSFKGNNISIKNDGLILNPFEKKKVLLRCKLDSISKKPYISIFAESRNGKRYSIYNRKATLLNYSENSKYLKSILKLNYYYDNNKKGNKVWKLKTYFNQDSYLTLKANSFRIQYKNKNGLWQIGRRYFNSFVQLGNQGIKSNRLKLSYQNNFNSKNKRIIYTNFNNEIAIGNYYKDNNKYYYLELNASKNHLNHYFKGRWKGRDISYKIKNYKKTDNILYNIEVKKKLKNKDIFKMGYYSKDNQHKKYFRYINDTINNKMTYGYSLKTTDRYEKKKILYINENERQLSKIIKFDYGINNYFYKKDKKYLAFMFKIDSYRMNLKINDFLKDNNIKFKLSKFIKSNKLNSLVIIDNYNGLGLGLENKFNYRIDSQKKLSFEGYYSYNFKKQKFYSKINFGLSIPLTFVYKDRKEDLITLEARVKDDNKDLAGIVFDVNGKKIKTDKKGNFSLKTTINQKLKVEVVDLGKFKGNYFLQPQSQILTDNYKGEKIGFKLVKYTNLKVGFKRIKTTIDKYIESKDKELIYVRLYNKENEYIKKYEGEQEINFNKIKPGIYNLAIENIYSPFGYNNKIREVKITTSNNKIVVKKKRKNSNKFEKESKIIRLKVKN
jgi:hypothetical protein